MWVGFPGRLVMYTYTAAIQILLTSAVQAELFGKTQWLGLGPSSENHLHVRRGPTGGYIKYYIKKHINNINIYIYIYRYLKRTSQWIRHPLTVSSLNGEKIDDVKLGSTFWKMNFPEIRPTSWGWQLIPLFTVFFHPNGGRLGFLPSTVSLTIRQKQTFERLIFFNVFFH